MEIEGEGATAMYTSYHQTAARGCLTDLVYGREPHTPYPSPVSPQHTHQTSITRSPQLHQCRHRRYTPTINGMITHNVGVINCQLITLAVLSCDPLTISLSFGEMSTEFMSCGAPMASLTYNIYWYYNYMSSLKVLLALCTLS